MDKQVEKYDSMSGKQAHEIPMLEYITSKGSVDGISSDAFVSSKKKTSRMCLIA